MYQCKASSTGRAKQETIQVRAQQESSMSIEYEGLKHTRHTETRQPSLGAPYSISPMPYNAKSRRMKNNARRTKAVECKSITHAIQCNGNSNERARTHREGNLTSPRVRVGSQETGNKNNMRNQQAKKRNERTQSETTKQNTKLQN